MRELLQAYPYLMLSLALLILAGLALWMRPEHRRGMMWSGVLSAPCALYAVFFVPQYWQPRQVFRFMAGPEDLIFSFANGVVVWAMVADGSLRIRTRPRWAQTTVRGGFLTGVFLLQWGVFLELGLRLMDAACSSAAVILTLLILRRPSHWRAALRGGAFFSLYYALVLGALALLVPSLFEQWNRAALSGLRLGSIPVEEILWAALFGAVWPCLVAFLTEEEPHRSGLEAS